MNRYITGIWIQATVECYRCGRQAEARCQVGQRGWGLVTALMAPEALEGWLLPKNGQPVGHTLPTCPDCRRAEIDTATERKHIGGW